MSSIQQNKQECECESELECPICMDTIILGKNIVTTECGHTFHSSCLMTSVAHRGFGCPYCRSVMATEISEPEEEDQDGEYEDDDDWEEIYDDYALRGFRFLMNRISGEESDEADLNEELEYEENRDGEIRVSQTVDGPSIEQITQSLVQSGVTMEDMIKSYVYGFDTAYENESLRIAEGQIYGKVSHIIIRHRARLSTSNIV